MKKSLIIFNWRDPQHPNAGGSEEYFLNYGRELIKKGWRVTWLTSRVRGKKRNEKMEGIYIKRRGGFITKHFLIPIQYILFENKHCTHIIDSENGMPFFTPLFSRKKIFLLVHHVHQDIFKKHLTFPFSSIACFIEKNIIPIIYRNKNIFAVSPSTKKELLDIGFKEDKIDIAYNTINIDNYYPGNKSKKPIFLYLGRITKQKNIKTFIDTIPEIKKEFPFSTFVIAGSGPYLENLKTYSKDLDIEYPGFVTEKERLRLLQEAYVLIQPSEKEGWGITVLEASTCGTPTIASNVDGLIDAVKEGANGYLFEFGNSEDLFKKIIKVKSQYQTLQKSSVEYSKKYNIKTLSKTFEEYLIK